MLCINVYAVAIFSSCKIRQSKINNAFKNYIDNGFSTSEGPTEMSAKRE